MIAVAAGVVVALGAAAAFAVTLHAYQSASHRANHYKNVANAAAGEVAAAHRSASLQYSAGLTTGESTEKKIEQAEGLTYAAGHRDVFAGFKDPWIDGNWYLVKIDHSAYGHDIKYRYDVQVCRSMYVNSNDDLYSGGYDC